VAPSTFLRRNWFAVLAICSLILVLITAASYAFQGVGGLFSSLLFFTGLGGENNIGAWWSGMLLLLSAAFAFDGYSCAAKPRAERNGWLALSIALALLSFDEVASLHEFLAGIDIRYLVPFGLIGIGLVAYALMGFRRGGVRRPTIVKTIVAFGLLATVPLQEVVQLNVAWSSPVVYGIRALLEEGTEIAAMLLLIAVTAPNSAALLRTQGEAFAITARYRPFVLIAGPLLTAALAAATFVLPYPPGPANWLMQSLYLLCTLLVLGHWLAPNSPSTAGAALLFLLYVAGGASSVVNMGWDPEVLGAPISLRGVGTAALLLAALPILRMNGRDVNYHFLVLAAAVVLAASVGPGSQLMWSALPPLVALGFFSIESQSAAVKTSQARVEPPPVAAPVADVPLRASPDEGWEASEFLEYTHDAIIIWEMDGAGITFWNRAAEKLYGYSRAEALGKVTHELLKTRIAGGVGKLEERLSQLGVWVGELRHTAKDGGRVDVQGRLALLSQHTGRWLVLEINRDITDLNRAKAAERMLEAQLSELKRHVRLE
jgi:PAS domain S-box-containing protein